MIVAISYHQGDQQLMTRWSNHVAKLGPYPNHGIVIAPVHNASTDEIEAILSPVFGSFHIQPCFHNESGWPVSCNKAFENVATYIEYRVKKPFLWMEPDAVPLRSSWIDEIEKEYNQMKRPFLGDFVQIRGVVNNGVDHMSGIAVYPWNLSFKSPSIFRNETIAWDIASGPEVIPQMGRSKLIQHDWVPTEKWRRDVVTPNLVNPLAAIYHPDKLGVLFNDGLCPNGVQGDPATGVPSEGSPHETKEISEKDTQIQPQEAPQDQQTILIERFNSILAAAGEDARLKRQVKSKLIEHGWIKDTKKAKRTGKKVRPPVVKF